MKNWTWLWWLLGLGAAGAGAYFVFRPKSALAQLPSGGVDWHHYKVVYSDGAVVTPPSAELADIDQAMHIAQSAAAALPSNARQTKMPVLVIDNQTGRTVYTYTG